MNRFLSIYALMMVIPVGGAFAQNPNPQAYNLTFTYTEEKVEKYYHFFLEGPASYKFISRRKVENPKLVRKFDFLEREAKVMYVQSRAAYIVKESGDTLASIVVLNKWFDIIMPDGRLYKFKRLRNNQWAYSLNGKEVFHAKLTKMDDKKVVSWSLTEVEPDAALALSYMGAAYSWSAVHNTNSEKALVAVIILGIIAAIAS